MLLTVLIVNHLCSVKPWRRVMCPGRRAALVNAESGGLFGKVKKGKVAQVLLKPEAD